MNKEEKLLNTKEHEWIYIKDEYAYIGITEHAQSELGDIIFVELPEVGDTFSANDVFGTIEAVKTVADLFMPMKGTIVEINKKIDTQPELINTSPYENGWLIKIKVADPLEAAHLLTFDSYKKLI